MADEGHGMGIYNGLGTFFGVAYPIELLLASISILSWRLQPTNARPCPEHSALNRLIFQVVTAKGFCDYVRVVKACQTHQPACLPAVPAVAGIPNTRFGG